MLLWKKAALQCDRSVHHPTHNTSAKEPTELLAALHSEHWKLPHLVLELFLQHLTKFTLCKKAVLAS